MNMNTTNELPKDIQFLCQWIDDFDKLLRDRIGVKQFAEFLKKEYSYENLKFWMSCKKYKNITDRQNRILCANRIYDKFLRPGAPEAVNIDNRALNAVKSGLKDPKPDLFSEPEKQIYELMKFDCYKRFLKSFYSNNTGSFNDKLLSPAKLNKSPSIGAHKPVMISRYRKNAFLKLKREELNEINRKIAKRKLQRTPKKKLINTSNGELNSSIAELNCRSKERHSIKCEPMERSTKMETIRSMQSTLRSAQKANLNNSSHQTNEKLRSLIVVFTNGQTERLYLNRSETVGHSLAKLLKNRNLNFTAFDAFPFESNKELDLNSDILDLDCHKIRVEQRIVFKVLLPNGVVINVRTKPSLMSAKVLNPILTEFNPKYDPEYYAIKFADTSEPLAPDMPIFCADNRKLIVVYNGMNENKSIETKGVVRNDISMFATKEIDILNEFLENENHFLNKSQKSINFLNLSDISFSDENKSETFLNDLMKCSQSVPENLHELTYSPKLFIEKQNKIFDKIDDSFEIKEKLNKSISPKVQNKRQINSPKLKLIDFKKKISPTLKSDQLYDKRYVRRTNKVISDQTLRNKSNENDKQCSEPKLSTNNSIQTLSKFHKTSDKLLIEPKSEPNISKIVVPKIFKMQ